MAKKTTYTIIVDGEVVGNLTDKWIAIHVAVTHYHRNKSVIVKNNQTRKTIARFVYGHSQIL